VERGVKRAETLPSAAMEDVRRVLAPPRVRDLGLARTIGVAAVALTTVVVACKAPSVISHVNDQAREFRALPKAQRALLPARSADVDTRVFVEARHLIPADATYAVITGAKVTVSTPNTLAAIAPFARYYLLPRRQMQYPQQAQWVLSFGGDLDKLGLRYARRIAVLDGVELAEVAPQ
jgi:hypothetical protein